jgi:hypothetical protein
MSLLDADLLSGVVKNSDKLIGFVFLNVVETVGAK